MILVKNNLKISWRNLWNNWGSSLLNITGLTLGVLCSILIFLTIKYEFSFDEQHQNADEIYRVTSNYYYPTFTMYVGETPDPMANALKNDFPSFKSVVPIYSSYNHLISVGGQIFESNIIYAGSEFIQLFDYYNDPSQWLIGNPKEALNAIELRFGILVKTFTFIAIIIACIGLIGLSAFSSVRRFKEIGVRKVLGVTVSNILFLMSKEFIVLTIIGFLISIPIAYYVANSWLEGFANSIDIEWWMVAIGGILTLVLTLITVGLQSVKVALANPIKSLKSE